MRNKKKATIRPEKHHITVNVFVRKVGNYSLISASNTAATSRNKRMNDSSLEKWTNHFSFRYRLHSGGERMISVYCRTNRMWRMCGQHEMNESLAEMTRCSKAISNISSNWRNRLWMTHDSNVHPHKHYSSGHMCHTVHQSFDKKRCFFTVQYAVIYNECVTNSLHLDTKMASLCIWNTPFLWIQDYTHLCTYEYDFTFTVNKSQQHLSYFLDKQKVIAAPLAFLEVVNQFWRKSFAHDVWTDMRW